ncbi:hypothetical protein ABPG75_004722 [Micractinium tetrahymenae]
MSRCLHSSLLMPPLPSWLRRQLGQHVQVGHRTACRSARSAQFPACDVPRHMTSNKQAWKPIAGAALLVWAAVLQWDMMRLKKDPRFKEKFPEHAAKEEEDEPERSLAVRLRSGEQEQR